MLAYDAKVNVAVVSGYLEDGARFLLRGYDGEQTIPADEFQIQALVLADGGDPLPRREAMLAALRLASSSWRSAGEAWEGKGRYHVGIAALRRWAADLDADADALPAAEREQIFFVSWWNFTSLADARAAAVRFLTSNRDHLEAAVRPDLDRAIDCYRASAERLNGAKTAKHVFLGPWSGKTIADWTPEIRRREVALLTEVAAIEEEAVTAIECVLSTVETGP